MNTLDPVSLRLLFDFFLSVTNSINGVLGTVPKVLFHFYYFFKVDP